MKREEAIKNIKEHCYFANLIPQAKEALDMAIEALEEPKIDNDLDMKLKLMGANINGYTQGLKDASNIEQEPCNMCEYATSGGCQYDDIAEVIPTEGKPCDELLSREERLKMLMETGEFEFLKDIPSDTIWKLVFMLEFIGNAESEEV